MHLVRENQPTLRVQSLPPLPAHSLDHPCAQGCSEQPNHDEQYFYEKKVAIHTLFSLPLPFSLPFLLPTLTPPPSLSLDRCTYNSFAR